METILVDADDSGRIHWRDVAFSPYTFAATFLPSRCAYVDSDHVKNLKFIVDEAATKGMFAAAEDESQNPLLQIALRQKGLVIGGILPDLKCCRAEEGGLLGYIFEVSDEQLHYMQQARIIHRNISHRVQPGFTND